MRNDVWFREKLKRCWLLVALSYSNDSLLKTGCVSFTGKGIQFNGKPKAMPCSLGKEG